MVKAISPKKVKTHTISPKKVKTHNSMWLGLIEGFLELNDKFRKHCFLFTSYLYAGFPHLPLTGGKFHYPCRERSVVSEFTLLFF